MFTQQHFVQVANVIHEQRQQIKAGGANVDVNLAATNQITLALAKMFKKHNAKFSDLKFIEACNKDQLSE